jgi:uncharacterized protein (TIGR02147 family)
MINIFDYIDYRRYLSDYYEDKKRTSSAFSHRWFARKAGFSSPVFLKQVIEGERNLTENMLQKFIKGLALNQKESRYFQNLVGFNQAKTAVKKQEHYSILRSMMHMVDERMLTPHLYDYFNYWYTPVVRELLCLYDFSNDYCRLAESMHPAIKEQEAASAVSLLKRLKLIERAPNGGWRQCDEALATHNELISSAIRSFNRQMIEHAISALNALPVHQRYASGITLTCSEQLYQALIAEIEAFRERAVALVSRNDKPHTRVMQLNVQLFPVSKELIKKDDGQ